MKKIEVLFLSLPEVEEAGLGLTEMASIVEEVLTEHGSDEFENPPKPGVHPAGDAFIHAMPGYLPRKDAIGLKWVSGYSSNPANHGLTSVMGLIVINDVDTGQPLAIMDCAYITAVRTAAVSGIAAKYLANPDSKTLGITGAGVQAQFNLLMMKDYMKELEVAKVFDIRAEAVQAFIEKMQPQVPFKIEAGETVEEVVKFADIMIGATGKLTKVIYHSEWVKEGALVLPVHMLGWEPKTVHDMDKFVVDDWEQFNDYLGKPGAWYHPLPELDAQLGEVVVGKKVIRENKSDRIINFNYGMAIHDVLIGKRVMEKAKEKGLGTNLFLMEG